MNRGRVLAPLTLALSLSVGCGGGDDPPRPATATATATATVTAEATETAEPADTPTATPTLSPVPTATLPPSATPVVETPTVTPTATPSATATVTRTASNTRSPSPTVTPPPTPEPPQITYLGVARADDLPQTTALADPAGRPIFVRALGQGMTIILEGRGRRLRTDAYDPLGGLPGAQFLVSRPLGDGSPAVCDFDPPNIGGVPGIDPPEFSDAPAVVAAINDLGCRVNDGTGAPQGRVGPNACTRNESYDLGFVDERSRLQFCLPIARDWAFAPGDTIVAARVQDATGAVSESREIVVRVLRAPGFACAEGLGERVVTLARPASRLETSLDPGVDASADPWLDGPLRICAGPDLGDGIHPLSLRADAVLGLRVSDGTTLCAKVFARGSGGSIDCDGGTAYDVLASQDAEGPLPVAVDVGLGLNAGAGAAAITAPVAFVRLPAGSNPEDCDTLSYESSFSAGLTTATGRAEVLHPRPGGGEVALSATGANFDCDAWTQIDGPGALVLPFPALDTRRGDVAAVLVLSDQP